MKRIVTFGLFLLLATSAVLAQAKYQPKLTLAQAREIALKAVPGGTVKSEEFEKEKGKWIYSFDILKDKAIREIWVDPDTGKILQDEPESAAQENQEKD